MNPAVTSALLGIDWGTSNRRAWWLAADGAVLAEHADDQGLLAVQGRYAEALKQLLALGPALAPEAPILMSGMVGSASGWLEVPYLDAAVPLRRITEHLTAVPAAGPHAYIVPGVCLSDDAGRVDVMRGEEAQLLGALALGHGDGWYVLPGTHSKWVRLFDARVVDLATCMTGELFALLTQHGTLASVTRATLTTGTETASNPQAFARGVAAAGRSGLSNALFGCRAQVVSGHMPASHARDYLSGLLIGAEWHEIARRADGAPPEVTLIGSPQLAERYATVAAMFGCKLNVLDASAVQLAAWRALHKGWSWGQGA